MREAFLPGDSRVLRGKLFKTTKCGGTQEHGEKVQNFGVSRLHWCSALRWVAVVELPGLLAGIMYRKRTEAVP